MDIEIRKFRKSLVDLINETRLPIEVKRLVVSDVLLELTKAADETVMQLMQQAAQEAAPEENKEEKEDGAVT